MPVINKTTNSRPIQTSKSRSVIDRIGPIGFGGNDGIKLLAYGKSAMGKTTMWATFPKPILAVVCSGGNRTGELRSIDTEEYRKTIRQVVLESSSEFHEIVPHAREAGYQTVVLDHASGLQDLILKEILGIDEIPVAKTWGLASQQQYGQCTVQAKTILRSLLSLDANVVIVAQERESKPEGDSDVIIPFVGPALMPQLAAWLNSAVDYICQAFIRQREEVVTTTLGTGKTAKTMSVIQKVKGVEYCLRTAPDPTYATKFRVPKGFKIPDVILDPDYDKILSVIHGQ